MYYHPLRLDNHLTGVRAQTSVMAPLLGQHRNNLVAESSSSKLAGISIKLSLPALVVIFTDKRRD